MQVIHSLTIIGVIQLSVWSGKIWTGFFRQQKQRLMKDKHRHNKVKS